MSEAAAPTPVVSEQRLEAESLWQNPLAHELRAPQPATANLSEERLDSLASIAESLHQTMPEFAGMTVFGSTARGEARLDSDADIFVFVKPTEAEGSPQMNPRIGADETKLGIKVNADNSAYNQAAHPTYIFHGAIDLDYKAAVLDQLKSAAIESADIDVLPIDEAIVDEASKALLESAQQFKLSDVGEIAISRNLRGLFHRPVDDAALQPYIRRTLDHLAGSQFGELAWSAIRDRVISFEKGRDTKQEDFKARNVPTTLVEAQTFYGDKPDTTGQ